jgi:hypothetical protein
MRAGLSSDMMRRTLRNSTKVKFPKKRYLVKRIRLFVSVGLLVALMVVSPGCASTAEPMETEADLIGFITETRPNGEGDILGQINVESHADKIVSKYIITITDETLIFQQDGDDLHRTAFKTLENKQWVKIWFTGPVMESFPARGTAGQVVIIGE